MRVFLCIDDTDNLDSRGTGELANIIVKTIEDNRWGSCEPITRHQLFLHPDVPYTSHNSSMCFCTELKEEYLNALTDYASGFLEKESAEGSDPGLCLARVDQIEDLELLKTFGQQAKTEVLTKQYAYDLAKNLGIHLSEHGGTGQGIIGALAGVGLRLTGNDGRLQGKIKIESVNEQATVRDIIAKTKINSVRSLDGSELENDELIKFDNDWIKGVLLDGKFVLLVNSPDKIVTGETVWQPCTKQQLKDY